MSEEQTHIDFPVGDDPDEPGVIGYWEEVVKRLRGAKLHEDLVGWDDAIQDRIDTFRAAKKASIAATERLYAARQARLQDAASYQEIERAFIKAEADRSMAASEFAGMMRKLSRQFREHYDLGGPLVRSLFAPRGLALVRE